MQATNTITTGNSNILPSAVSPEFAEWLTNEKADAQRHQRRIFRATMMLGVAMALFILKEQSGWVALLLDLDAYAAK